MRFIANFILFAIIFYALWFFFPEAFAKAVSGIGAAADFLKEIGSSMLEKLNKPTAPTTPS